MHQRLCNQRIDVLGKWRQREEHDQYRDVALSSCRRNSTRGEMNVSCGDSSRWSSVWVEGGQHASGARRRHRRRRRSDLLEARSAPARGIGAARLDRCRQRRGGSPAAQAFAAGGVELCSTPRAPARRSRRRFDLLLDVGRPDFISLEPPHSLSSISRLTSALTSPTYRGRRPSSTPSVRAVFGSFSGSITTSATTAMTTLSEKPCRPSCLANRGTATSTPVRA